MKNTNVKNAFLLGASLQVLHQESREWLEQVEFWKDEVSFFNRLLHKKTVSEGNNKPLKELMDSFNNISLDLLKEIEKSVIEHEKLLARLIDEDKGISDWTYRENHRKLKNSIEKIETDFRTFKKLIFSYVKNLD